MPAHLVRLFFLIFCLCVGQAWAAGPAQVPDIVLDDATPSFQIGNDVANWMDVGSRASIADVAADGKRFKLGYDGAQPALNQGDTLWIKLRLRGSVAAPSDWTLNIPSPLLDSVTIYQRQGSGAWRSQSAGDTLAQADWAARGLYPDFDLHLSNGVATDVYLQVRNFTPLSLPIRIATKAHRQAQRQLELLALGLSMGALLSLAVLSALHFVEHRSAVDLWASLYALLITATVAQVNGVLNATLWAAHPLWGDHASGILPAIAVGCALIFVQTLYALSTHYHRYGTFLNSVGVAAIASVLTYAVLDRSVARVLSDAVLLACICAGLLITLLSWSGGSSVRRLLAASTLPQFAGVMYMFADGLGLVPGFWEMRYLTSLFAAISVPVTVHALAQITHDRKERAARANHLPTHDALTGLLTPAVFQTHLHQAVQRANKSGQPIGLAVLQVVNYEFLRQNYGDAVGEQCLLRAVIKLQRVLRDVDPAARVDTAQFALLIEGVASRAALTEIMVKLIASGLIPMPGLVPEVTLHFQAACVLLHESPSAENEVLGALRGVLAGMSTHTRRPVRFLESVPTRSLAMDSGLGE